MNEKSSKLYVDIQSMFDLRHSALYQIVGEEQSLTTVTSEPYNVRECDLFEGVDPTQLQAYLASDDLRMLRAAPLSYIHVLLAMKVDTLEKRNAFLAEVSIPEVVVNFYPFRLDKDSYDALQNAVFVKLGSKCKVTLIYEDPKKISPSFIKHNGFVACFMYDFTSWIETHSKALENGDLMDIMMYFAGLYKVSPTKEDIKMIRSLGFADVFSYTEYLFIGKMQLNFLPSFMFSSVVTATVFMDKNKDLLLKEKLENPVKDYSL